MDTPETANLRMYYGGGFLAAAGLLVYGLYRWPPAWPDALPLLVAAVFVALVTLFPAQLATVNVFPFQGVTIALAMMHGPTVAALAAIVGLVLGVYGLSGRVRRWGRIGEERSRWVAFNLIWHVVPLLAAALLVPWRTADRWALSGWGEQGAFLGMVLVGHLLLWFVDLAVRRRRIPPLPAGQTASRWIAVYLLPLPFVWGLVAAHDRLGLGTLVLIGGLVLVLSALGWRSGAAQAETDRRQQEIRVIESVGRTLQDTLDLDALLSAIQVQVMQVVGVDSFYVALLDEEAQSLWYPLAVKHGRRQQWPRRPLTDRLTDRVILRGQPILVSRNAEAQRQQLDLPADEDLPSAWLGVPLIAQGRTTGCLAVFTTVPGVTLDEHRLRMLEALSGQVSVAIQNALLYQQARQRAAQLEALTRASAGLLATLNPKEVLARICEAATEITGADRVAVLRVDPAQKSAYLVQSRHLSRRTRQALASVMLEDGLGGDFGGGRPVFVLDVERTNWPRPLREALQLEGVRAAALFPLGTPQEAFGTLALWFDQPQPFDQDVLLLMQTFVTQASLAIANARLYTRTDSALSRRVEQLSILEAIGRELAAAIRSERVFEMVLQFAADFTRSEWGALSLWDEDANRLSVHTLLNYPPGIQSGQAAVPLALEALRRRQVVYLGRVREDSRFVDYTAGRAQSHVSVPLIHEGQALGVISLESSRPVAYDESDIAFLRQLANQAAVALVNARLYRESQAHLKELALLYQTGMRLSATVDVQTVLTILAQALLAVEPEAQIATYTWRQGEYWRVTTHAEGQPQPAFPERVNLEDLGALASALTQTGPLYLAKGEPFRRQLQAPETAVVTLFPLQVARERLGMVLLVLPDGHQLASANEQVIRSLTTQGSLAMQNALLFGDVRQVRDRLMAVLNAVGDGVLMIQSDGRIALANAPVSVLVDMPLYRLLGQRLQELPPEVLNPLGLTPAAARRVVMKMNSTYSPTTPRQTYRFTRQGQELVIERITSPVMDEKGEVIGWVFVFRDMTEQHHLNAARDLITDTLVHDLRSPLSAIISALDLIQVELEQESTEIARQSIRIAQRSAKRMIRLVQSLLEISRMEAGMVDLSLRLHPDLVRIVRDIVEDYKPQAVENGLLLRSDLPETLPPVRMDADKISRVLINLIDNALKFTPEGGQILVTAGMEGEEHVCISVCDTGPGVPPEFQSRIFERFVQVPGHGGRRRGVGLGLTFSRLVVEAHGGHIRVQNRPEGGAEFSIILPLAGPEGNESA